MLRSDRSFSVTIQSSTDPTATAAVTAELDAASGLYKATVTPTSAGASSLTLTYEGSFLPGFPVDLLVLPGPVAPAQSVLRPLPAQVTAGAQVTAVLEARDQFGNMVRPAACHVGGVVMLTPPERHVQCNVYVPVLQWALQALGTLASQHADTSCQHSNSSSERRHCTQATYNASAPPTTLPALAISAQDEAAAVVFSAAPPLPSGGIASAATELTVAGTLTFSATIDATAVSGSGQVVNVLPGPAHPPQSTFALAAAQIVAGSAAQLSAVAVDEFGNQLASGGSFCQCAPFCLKCCVHKVPLRDSKNALSLLYRPAFSMRVQVPHHQHKRVHKLALHDARQQRWHVRPLTGARRRGALLRGSFCQRRAGRGWRGAGAGGGGGARKRSVLPTGQHQFERRCPQRWHRVRAGLHPALTLLSKGLGRPAVGQTIQSSTRTECAGQGVRRVWQPANRGHGRPRGLHGQAAQVERDWRHDGARVHAAPVATGRWHRAGRARHERDGRVPRGDPPSHRHRPRRWLQPHRHPGAPKCNAERDAGTPSVPDAAVCLSFAHCVPTGLSASVCVQVGIDADDQTTEVEAGALFSTFVTPRDDIGSLVFWPVVSDFLITALPIGSESPAFSLIPEHTGNGFDAYADPPRILVVEQALTVRRLCGCASVIAWHA